MHLAWYRNTVGGPTADLKVVGIAKMDGNREECTQTRSCTYSSSAFSLRHHSCLTGVANRRAFDERLNHEWNRASRAGSALAVVMIDVDFFKLYNDLYGHSGGDDCLKKVAIALADSLQREYDFFARYGGEEFAAVLPGMEEKVLRQTIQKMCLTIAEVQIPHADSTVAEFVTISLGGATTVPTRESSSSELLAQADAMLYEAKDAGRNQGKTHR
jgi:diguanylate cyclase (GGDEF)-like protein|tara:strand:- start:170 stop:814 length:645 start_codon:yes stop_codon:yes gene_type:complete